MGRGPMGARCDSLARLSGYVVIRREREVLLKASNVVVNSLRQRFAEWLAGQESAPYPEYIGVGTKRAAPGTDLATLTALEDELKRVAITSRSATGEREARLVSVFKTAVGSGEWQEIGLFLEPERACLLSDCDSTANWSSDNTLSLEATDYKEGNAALEALGTGTVDFLNTTLTPSYDTYSFTESDKLQLWYYIDDVANLAGSIFIEISSSATVDVDEYQFEIKKADLSNGWNWISKVINEATKVGSPDLNAIVRFRLHATKAASALSRIDKIRLFGDQGLMWARAELATPIEKGLGEVWNVYWYLKIT